MSKLLSKNIWRLSEVDIEPGRSPRKQMFCKSATIIANPSFGCYLAHHQLQTSASKIRFSNRQNRAHFNINLRFVARYSPATIR